MIESFFDTVAGLGSNQMVCHFGLRMKGSGSCGSESLQTLLIENFLK